MKAERLLRSAASTVLRQRSASPKHEWPDGWKLVAPARAVELVASGPPVRGLLCFNSNRLNVREWPTDIIVTTRANLGWTLENMQPVVGVEEAIALYELARRSTTWTRDVARTA